MKYFAKEERSDYIELERYFSEKDAIEQQIYIGGNFSYDSVNEQLISPIVDGIEELSSLLEDKKSELRKLHRKIEIPSAEYKDLIDEVFHKKNFDEFTEDDYWTIRFGMEDLKKSSSFETELRVYSEILGVIVGDDFTYDILKGKTSDEYTGCIFPKSVSYKEIEMIENVFFSKIKEYEVTTEPIESIEDFNEVPRVYWANLRNEYNVEKAIADFLGCSESEVEIFKPEEQEE